MYVHLYNDKGAEYVCATRVRLSRDALHVDADNKVNDLELTFDGRVWRGTGATPNTARYANLVIVSKDRRVWLRRLARWFSVRRKR